jgi:hypothetical protein
VFGQHFHDVAAAAKIASISADNLTACRLQDVISYMGLPCHARRDDAIAANISGCALF